MTVELHIVDRFRERLPHLSADENQQLRENLESDGKVLSPIVYWYDGEKYCVVDGMHRLPIAIELGLPYDTEQMHFDSPEHAEIWIMKHALGQRNMPDTQAARIVLGQLILAMQSQGNVSNHEVFAAVAEGHGVSVHQARRGKALAKALDGLPSTLAAKLKNNEIVASDADIILLAKQKTPVITAIARDIRVGSHPTISAALIAHKIKKVKPTSAPKPPPIPTAESVLQAAEEDESKSNIDRMHESNKRITAWAKQLKAVAVLCPTEFWVAQVSGSHDTMLKQVDGAIKTIKARMGVICPRCAGDGCDVCMDQGFLPKVEADKHGG